MGTINEPIRVLHIVKDDKFYRYFDSFRDTKEFVNIRALISNKPNYHITWIPESSDIMILYKDKAIRELLNSDTYDAVFLQSLTKENKRIIQYIPKDKYIIWRCYGYELYTSLNGLDPLIPIDVYMPLTRTFFLENQGSWSKVKEGLKKWALSYYYSLKLKKWLGRIDFFQPVIPIEYSYMLKNKHFHAKEFYPHNSYNYEFVVSESRARNGGIMIGNSSTYTNNHLDIINSIKAYLPKDRNIIFPLSYGDISPEILINRMGLGEYNVRYLTDFIPREEYFNMLNNCSYFISGVLRQQSMGNISYCLRNGIKLFLFKKSLVYQYLKEAGFVVFSIEDIDHLSFVTPMTPDEQEKNRKAAENRKLRQDTISEDAIKFMKSNRRYEYT